MFGYILYFGKQNSSCTTKMKIRCQLVTGISQVKNLNKPHTAAVTLLKFIDLFIPKIFFLKLWYNYYCSDHVCYFFPQITALSVIGGIDTKDTVWRVMKHCFTNSLAKQLNWRGINGKTAFRRLQLKDVITGKCCLGLFCLAMCLMNWFSFSFTFLKWWFYSQLGVLKLII